MAAAYGLDNTYWTGSQRRRFNRKAKKATKQANSIVQKNAQQKAEEAATRTYEEGRTAALRQLRSKQSEANELSFTDPQAAAQMNSEAKSSYAAQMKQIEDAYNTDMKNAKAAGKQAVTDREMSENPEEQYTKDQQYIQEEANKQRLAKEDAANEKNSDGPNGISDSDTTGSDSGGNNNSDGGSNSTSGNGTSGKSSGLSGTIKNVAGGMLGAYFAGKAKAGDPTGAQAHLRNQAKMHDKQAGDEQKNAQANFQVANRDYRVEAEKNAASQAAAENAQKVHNMGNASAGAAALERDVKSADYNTHMQRQDQQRQQGVENQREMWSNRQVAESKRADADADAYLQNQTKQYNLMSDALSMGKPEQKQEEPAAEEPAAEEPAAEEPAAEEPAAEEPAAEEPAAEEPQEEQQQEEQAPDIAPGMLHNVFNYLAGSMVYRTSESSEPVPNPTQMRNSPEFQNVLNELKQYTGEALKPINTDKSISDSPEVQQKVREAYPKFYALYDKGSGRNLDTAQQENTKDGRSEAWLNQGMSTPSSSSEPSDRRIKNIINTLSKFKYF